MPDTPFAAAADRVRAGADPAAEAADLVALMTPDELRWCLDGDLPFWAGLDDLGKGGYHRRTFPAAEVDRLGIPGFHFSDGPRGVVIGPATCFPVSMARGATWDVDLEERIGDAIGRELRAVGADLYGGVCVNVLRHPAWGRAQETYGEDPFHIGELGAALTRGVQRHAMACVKHFALNSMENARFSVDVTVDEQALHEVFLPHFKRIVDEGVACVMSAYNAVNGEWCGQSPQLLTEVLRDEWGFTGMVISDWIFGLRDAGPSVAAGLDVEMPYRMVRAGGLDRRAGRGRDRRGRHRHRGAAHGGHAASLRGGPGPARAPGRRARVRRAPRAGAGGGHQVRRAAPQRARRGHAGAPARRGRAATRGRRRSPRGHPQPRRRRVERRVGARRGHPARRPARRAARVEVIHHDGAEPAAAASVAEWCDVAVVVVGYTRADEGEFIGDSGTSHLQELLPGPDDPELVAAFAARIEAGPHHRAPEAVAAAAGGEGSAPESGLGFAQGGDRTSLRLHPDDEALIAAVAAANPRTVVAVVAGSAVVTEAWRHAGACGRAVLVRRAWRAATRSPTCCSAGPSPRAGCRSRSPPTRRTCHRSTASADAVTYDGWHGYWRLARDGNAAAHPFGFGLSYTSLALGDASVELGDDGAVLVTTVARNEGARAGTEVVQVYGGASGTPPRLVGFARVDVPAGASVPVQVRVAPGAFARRPVGAGGWVAASGPHDLVVARHAEDPDARRLTVDLRP